MDLLLDTHAFIWFLNGDYQLSDTIRKKIADTSNRCYISIASLWEIAIKLGLNKLEIKGDFGQIADFLIENEIEVIPITFQHVQCLLQLQLHHRDPFDRILIAQAIAENLALATKDEVFVQYGVNTKW